MSRAALVRKSRRLILLPQSWPSRLMSWLQLAVDIFNLVTIPFVMVRPSIHPSVRARTRAGAHTHAQAFSSAPWRELVIAAYCADACTVAHIAACFIRAYRENGVLITDPAARRGRCAWVRVRAMCTGYPCWFRLSRMVTAPLCAAMGGLVRHAG
jgi:hypothetical protein